MGRNCPLNNTHLRVTLDTDVNSFLVDRACATIYKDIVDVLNGSNRSLRSSPDIAAAHKQIGKDDHLLNLLVASKADNLVHPQPILLVFPHLQPLTTYMQKK